jgi:hypothetical protein
MKSLAETINCRALYLTKVGIKKFYSSKFFCAVAHISCDFYPPISVITAISGDTVRIGVAEKPTPKLT